jgi:WXG100 family type VII secretion target
MAQHVMQTETDLMATAATDTQSASGQLANAFNTLLNDLSDLDREWQGQGGIAFKDLIDRLTPEYVRLYGALEWIGDATRTGGNDIVLTDEELRGAMQRAGAPLEAGSITSALNGVSS